MSTTGLGRPTVELPRAAPEGPPAEPDPLDRLAELGELRAAGVLTEAAFEAQKHKLLDA